MALLLKSKAKASAMMAGIAENPANQRQSAIYDDFTHSAARLKTAATEDG